MQKSLLINIILGSLIFSLSKCFTCESRCPYVRSSYGICANDGKVYASLCHARCKNYSAYVKFNCSSGYTNCQYQCFSHKTSSPGSITTIDIKVTTPTAPSFNICEKKCLLTPSFAYFCGSDGNVYQSPCQARCPVSYTHLTLPTILLV